MNEQEAAKMLGTEFTYVYDDGDTVKAFVKAFDPEIGLTCMTLETQSLRGWKGSSSSQKEDDGTWCVIGMDFKRGYHSVEMALEVLEEIATTGKLNVPFGAGGGANCSF